MLRGAQLKVWGPCAPAHEFGGHCNLDYKISWQVVIDMKKVSSYSIHRGRWRWGGGGNVTSRNVDYVIAPQILMILKMWLKLLVPAAREEVVDSSAAVFPIRWA